eukprot:4152941-Pyramimonas_sp.AAC.1
MPITSPYFASGGSVCLGCARRRSCVGSPGMRAPPPSCGARDTTSTFGALRADASRSSAHRPR